MSDRFYDFSKDDLPEYIELRRSEQIAKRDHTCTACGKIIPKGTKYARRVGKYDGEMFSDKLHDFNANCVLYI